MTKLLRLAYALAVMGGAATPALAADADADFYKDKQIHLVVSTPPGGNYDAFARLMAVYLPKYIPGKPAIVVQNMGGGAGMTAANYMANQAPRDGTYIAGVHGSIPTNPLLSPNEARYDATKINWLGSITQDPFVAYVWHTSKINKIDQLFTETGIFGGAGVGAASIDYAIIAREFLGLKLKIITGYANSPDVKLAMEKGEVDGTFGNAWTSLNAAEPTWLPEKKVRLLLQFGLKPHPDIPKDIPLFVSLAKNDQDRQALELLLSRQEISKPYLAPPEVPAGRVAILRKAFDQAIKDPGFLADTKKAGLPVDGPMNGADLGAMTARLNQTPKAVVERINGAFINFKDGK
jgi:tripartite-type tricarboxylate transporter receptor subunit TctC